MAGTYARETGTLVIGGGPGGYIAAIRLGQLGLKVLLVERRELGGECLNRGCIPSKALIHAAGLLHAVRTEGPEIGVLAENPRFDLAKAMAWKESVIQKERSGVQQLLKLAGVQVLKGEARLTGPNSAELTAPDGGRERIDFSSAILATGASPTSFPGFEPDGDRVLTAEDILTLGTLPKSMLVLGGGVSGCELGEFLARVGVRVTIVELLSQLLPGVDPDLSQELTGTFLKEGVEVRVGTRATHLLREKGRVVLTVVDAAGSHDLEAERLFLTVGKRPESNDLGLEEAGVTRDPKSGFITVDAQQRTNVSHIYAVGDVARPPMLAHKAYREGVVAAEAIAGRPTRFQFQTIPSVVFTDPELASVGLTMAEAGAQGHAAREARFPFAALGRAHAAHATKGWLKIVGDDQTGLLLGVQAAGESVGEFIAEAGLAIEMAATVRDLAMTIHPHPTFSETLQEAALLWLGEPFHVVARKRVARDP
ncbi:MAG: dihydrolipoyl dehydrogenase [Thermoplasmata archaeon]|nr:dihydrolipoyl dehydrogenase [Thermoplasmata archaeon]MCI4358813.1 dihydrolipoyl dehydrogenase [Thermoplasmata archaeon]